MDLKDEVVVWFREFAELKSKERRLRHEKMDCKTIKSSLYILLMNFLSIQF